MGGDQTTTQSSTPWAPSIEPRKNVLSSAQQIQQNLPALYQGPFVSQPTQAQYGGLEGILNTAQNTPSNSSATNAAQSIADKLLNGGYTPPTFSQYDTTAIQPVIDSLTRPILEKYQEQLIPQLQDTATAQGASYGSRNERVTPDIISRNFGREVADTATRTGYNDYLTQLDAQQKQQGLDVATASALPGLFSQGFETQLLPYLWQGKAGEGFQQLGQYPINDALAADAYARGTPTSDLSNIASIISAISGGYGTSTTTQPAADPFTQILSAVAPIIGAGAGPGGFISNLFSTTAPAVGQTGTTAANSVLKALGK